MTVGPAKILTDRFTRALDFAMVVHATQVRKGTRVPYIAHLLGVASLAIEHGADEDTAIAALLHDAAEDPPRVRIVVAPIESMNLGAMMRGRGGAIRKGIQGSSGGAVAAAGERNAG